MHFKDSMRETSLGDISEAWYQLVAGYHAQQPELAAFVLETLQRYVHWMDIGLVANSKFVPLLFVILGELRAHLSILPAKRSRHVQDTHSRMCGSSYN